VGWRVESGGVLEFEFGGVAERVEDAGKWGSGEWRETGRQKFENGNWKLESRKSKAGSQKQDGDLKVAAT